MIFQRKDIDQSAMTFDLYEIVKQMKLKEEMDIKHIVEMIQNEKTLTG